MMLRGTHFKLSQHIFPLATAIPVPAVSLKAKYLPLGVNIWEHVLFMHHGLINRALNIS